MYERGLVGNIFQRLDTDCSLIVIGLCLASHDMALHHRLMESTEAEEKSYHFAASLSILREVAKIIESIDRLAFAACFSQNTRDRLTDMKRDLHGFQDGSLTRAALKPIRDFTFHYDLSTVDQERIGSLLAAIRDEKELSVRAISGDSSVLRYRYTFADAFRSRLVESYLTRDTVDQISVAVVNVIAFTDSLLADLSREQSA